MGVNVTAQGRRGGGKGAEACAADLYQDGDHTGRPQPHSEPSVKLGCGYSIHNMYIVCLHIYIYIYVYIYIYIYT